MRSLFLLTLVTASSFSFPAARAANLVTYSFDDSLDPAVQSGVTATAFAANDGSRASVGLGSAGPIDDPYRNKKPYAFILVTQLSTSVGSSVGHAQFAAFTVTPPAQNGMQIGQIQINAARGGKSNPRGLALRWSFDGYASDLGTAVIGSIWPDTTSIVFPLNAFAGGPVTFRLYAYAREISQAEASIRLTNLVVAGDPVLYPPVVTPQFRQIKTAKGAIFFKGTAYDSSGIARVEVARGSINGVYSGANGTTNWNYTATALKSGKNFFYVRAIDKTGTTGPAVRITVKRTTSPTPPRPTPKPTP